MNILLIEDDAGLVELITAMLEELGFSVISATSGTDAIAHLEKQTPDMILLDYSLPDINGKELIETLNKQQTPPPPFIITTGQGDERIAVDMMKLGAMDYLVKDILFLERLPDVVQRVVKEIESHGKLKQAEEAQKESEERFRELFDTINSGVAVYKVINDGKSGRDFIIQNFNRTALELEGLKKEDVVGKSLFDLRPNIEEYGLISVFRKVWKTGEPAFFPAKIYIDDNYSNYYENRVFRIPGGEIVAVFDDVSDRENAAVKIKESQERFKLAMDATKDGVYDWNLETNEIYYSPGWKSMLGYKDKELANDLSVWEKLTKPEDVEESWKIQQEVINKQRDRFEIEFKMQHKDGHWVDILARAEAFFDENGKAIRMVGTHVDISERKHEEKILDVELKMFEYAINHSEEELLRKFLDEAAKLTNSEIGFYHYVEDDQESISLQTWSSNTLNSMCKGVATRHSPISKAGVWIDCIKERKPVIHNDYSSLAHKKGLPEGHAPIIRELVVPVIRGNQIKAVLGVGNKKSDYNENDVKSIQRFADVAWETVVRKQAEEKIRATEENLKNTFDLSPSIICKANLDTGYFIEVNKAVTRILGLTVEEFASKHIMELIHPDDIQKTKDEISKLLKGNTTTFFENRYLCKNGAYKWIAWNATKADKNGVVTAIGSDISERKIIEQEIVKTKQFYENITEGVQDGIWVTDKNDVIFYANLAMEKIAGMPREQMQGNNVLKDLPETSRAFIKYYKQAKKEKKPVWYKIKIDTHVNKNTWQNGWFIPQYHNKKFTGLICTVRDITEHKQAEDKIRATEENLKNTFNLSPSIICKVNLDTGYFIEANQAVTRILGYSIEEFISTPFIELIHPDDRQRTIRELEEELKGKEVVFSENRYLCKDGSYKWMAWNGARTNKKGIIISIGSDISEHKIIEQEIVKTKQFYENIIEGVQDGIWVTDKNDVIFYANSAIEKIAGVPREQIQGKNILNDFPHETTGELIKFYKQAKKEKKPIWYDIEVRTLAYKDTWQNGWLIPQYENENFTGIICTIRDVSERKKAEGNVRKLSTAVHQSPSIIVIANTEGKVEYVNPKFTELTGYSSSEVIGQESNILKSGEQDSIFYKELWEIVESGKVWRGQFQNKKKDGELFWEAASISAILNEAGDIINYIKIGEDITQQKNTEVELKIALEKALESDRLKSAFLANMSHEIRTPMNGILGFINLLNEPNLSKSQIGEYSAIINKSGDRLLNTINDIIDISKIEAGEVLISTSEVVINTQIEELYSFFLPEVNRKGLSLLVDPSLSNEQLMVVTDSHKLHGILTNLIKNAIKYTEKGSISFGYFLKENIIEFYVKDTGIGIPKNRIKAIFNRFEQADIEDSRVFEGSGLGLTISKAYVEMLEGDISVTSEDGKGTTVKFTIPYTKKVKKEIELVPESTNNDSARIENLHLLIVEDDEVSSEFLRMILKNSFRKIIFAVNGIEAIEMSRNNPEIDLVLMDIKMPKMDGYEATREIRKFNSDLIIIAQTAFSMPDDKDKAIEAGCNDYISKPIDKKLLLELINRHTG